MIVVDVASVIKSTRVPLKLTIFSLGVVLKLVPVMVTVVPSAPLAGVKLVMVGLPTTVKSDVLVMSTPLEVTVIGPVAAPDGTVVVMLVEELNVAGVETVLNFTLTGVVKFVPVMSTGAPDAPLAGLNPVIVGVGRTVNVGPVTVTPFNVNVTGPVVAPTGTIVVNFLPVGFELETTASTPLNLTTFCEGVVLKLSPFIVTVAPTAPPLGGLRLVIIGVGNKVKPVLVAIPPGVVTDTFPEVPLATIAMI